MFSVALAQADELAVDFFYQNYEEARNAGSSIEFEVESTKAVFFTSTFIGIIKKFTVATQVEQNKLVKVNIDFAVLDMDTDNESRDIKMYENGFSHSQYPNVNVTFITPLVIGKEIIAEAIVTVRGATKNIKATVDVSRIGETLVINGSSDVKLSVLGIPDPSIMIASVRDLVEIRFNLELPLK